MANKNDVFVELEQAQKTRAEKIAALNRNLEKAEAFLRMLIRSADYCKAMRGIDYVHP